MKSLAPLAVALSLAIPGVALAGNKADCQWFEVQASNTKGAQLTVDKDLAPIDKKLHGKAWSSWNTYKKLAGDTVTLQQRSAAELKLKVGKASLLFDSQVSKSQLRLKVTMDNAANKRTVDTTAVIEAGDYIIFANEDKDNDTAHLLAVSCK